MDSVRAGRRKTLGRRFIRRSSDADGATSQGFDPVELAYEGPAPCGVPIGTIAVLPVTYEDGRSQASSLRLVVVLVVAGCVRVVAGCVLVVLVVRLGESGRGERVVDLAFGDGAVPVGVGDRGDGEI